MDDSQWAQLTSLGALEVSAQAKALPAHIERLLGAADAASSPAQAAVLRTLAAALQLDLIFLHAHPEDLFSALFMRCGLYDSVKGGQLGAPGPVAPTQGGLSALAQRWHDDYVQRGRPWVQSLLPPEHVPGGALITRLPETEGWNVCGISDGGDVFLHRSRKNRADRYARWSVRTCELSETATSEYVPPPAPGSLRVEIEPWTSATLCDGATGTRRALPIPAGGDVGGYTFSADGKLLVLSGTEDEYAGGFVQVYETATTRLLHSFHAERPFWHNRPALTPCCRYVIVMNDRGLLLWDLTRPQPDRDAAVLLPVEGPLARSHLSPSGTRLVVSSCSSLYVYDVAGLRALTKRIEGSAFPLCFSPDGRHVLVGTLLRDGLTGRLRRRINVARPWTLELEVEPPENYFFLGSARIIDLVEGVHVWDPQSGASIRGRDKEPKARKRHKRDKGLKRLKGLDASSERYERGDVIAFARDGRCYAVRRGLRQVCLLDSDTGALQATLSIDGATALAFSNDGSLLASGTQQGRVQIWDVKTLALVATLPTHAAPIATLCFARDARLLASVGNHEALRVSRVADGTEVAARPLDDQDPTYKPPCDGRKISSVRNERRRTWYPTDEAQQQLERWVGFVAPPAPRYSLRVSNRATCIVDTTTGSTIARLPLSGPWAAHPDAPIWAGPSAHLHLRAAP